MPSRDDDGGGTSNRNGEGGYQDWICCDEIEEEERKDVGEMHVLAFSFFLLEVMS